jgi:erythromycin esterase-like protein
MSTLINVLKEHAEPLPDITSEDFCVLFDRYADAQIVLIGEASHGTHEFYQARAAITRHLGDAPWIFDYRSRGRLARRRSY